MLGRFSGRTLIAGALLGVALANFMGCGGAPAVKEVDDPAQVEKERQAAEAMSQQERMNQ